LPSRISRKKKVSGTRLPVIECSCGAQILLVPNVKEMSAAIEAHIIIHTKKIKDAKEAQAKAERIRDDLIAKVLETASEL
jgi:hypothetical protein